jgi:membrane associated rhomboid family serine protease
MFMHAGWFHLLSNVWIFYIFGDNVEDRMGPFSFLLFYLISGIAAALLQTFLFPNSAIPVIGASGAIAGVLGAYILLYPAARVVTLLPLFIFFTVIRVPVFIFLGFWFVSQLFSGLASIGTTGGGIAWWAHIGGFVIGLLFSPLFRNRPQPGAESIDHFPDHPVLKP